MNNPLDLVVAKLKSAGCDPRQQGPDAWESRCPSHQGERRNLSLALGNGGAVIMCCHHVSDNGNPTCSASDIMGSLGLSMSELYPRLDHAHGNGAEPKPKPTGKRTWPTLDAALSAVASRIGDIVKTESWTYQEASGSLVMAVGRFDTADDKTYRPFHPTPDGWAVGDPAGLLPLYRLPEVIKSTDLVFIVEGEKCVLALEQFHLSSTTSAHGAQSPDKTDWSPLAGRNVVIVPDHDEPGEGYAKSVLRLLAKLNPRPTVKLVRLPDLDDGEDIADWLPRVVGETGGDDAHTAVWAALRALVLDAPAIDLDAIEDAPSEAVGPVAGSPVEEALLPAAEWPKPPEDVAFHGLAGEVVRLIEPTTEADPVGVLLQFLIGFGNAVGSGLSLEADGHRHHPNEYAVMVGDTSRARKGTAWRRVRPILTHVDSSWAESRVTSGLSSGEGLIWEVRDPLLGADKKTGEPIITDPGVDDKRALVVESEFGSVLRVLSREGNSLSGVLRLAWDGDDLRTMTKNNPARATRPHVSMIGHITQQELLKYLSNVEIFNGLGNRILWACVRRSQRLPFGGSLNDADVGRLGSRLAATADRAQVVGAMSWTSMGRARWESAYDVLTQDRPGLLGAVTARAEAHVLRLAMIYAVLDKSAEIADTHVEAALAAWRFCDRSAAHLFGGSLGDRDADAILDALRMRPVGLTRTEIRRLVFRDNKTSDEVARSLSLLLRHNLARPEMIDTGGKRPAERWSAITSGSTCT